MIWVFRPLVFASHLTNSYADRKETREEEISALPPFLQIHYYDYCPSMMKMIIRGFLPKSCPSPSLELNTPHYVSHPLACSLSSCYYTRPSNKIMNSIIFSV